MYILLTYIVECMSENNNMPKVDVKLIIYNDIIGLARLHVLYIVCIYT